MNLYLEAVRSTRGHCKPTHTYGGRRLDEVFLLARCARQHSAWLTPSGKLIVGRAEDFLLIPGRQDLFGEDLQRVGQLADFPLQLIRRSQYVARILTEHEKARQAIASKRLTVLHNGALVSASGHHWVIRNREERALVRHGLSYTHTIKGWGNAGPRGRCWWIGLKFTGFTPMEYELYGDQMPVDDLHPFAIEVSIGDWSDPTVASWLYEMKVYRSHWRYALQRDRYSVRLGFANVLDYGAFAHFVVTATDIV